MSTTEIQKIVNEQAQPIHITLTKNTKGYNWEISVYGDDVLKVTEDIDDANDLLVKQYGAQNNE